MQFTILSRPAYKCRSRQWWRFSRWAHGGHCGWEIYLQKIWGYEITLEAKLRDQVQSLHSGEGRLLLFLVLDGGSRDYCYWDGWVFLVQIRCHSSSHFFICFYQFFVVVVHSLDGGLRPLFIKRKLTTTRIVKGHLTISWSTVIKAMTERRRKNHMDVIV